MTADPRQDVAPSGTPSAFAPARPSHRPGRHPGRAAAPARPSRILCLDVETVPDAELVPKDWPRDRFPKPAWHKVAAISFAEARIEVGADGSERYVTEYCRSGGQPGWGEERLLAGFWRLFSEGDFRLVTWNGRRFDLPVLILRAFLYGIPAGAYFLRGDRWSGYTRRYAPEYHSDLAELLSSYGSATTMGLDEMARAMGLPGKGEDHGSMVEALANAGEIERVRSYCEGDVLNTMALFYRWSLMTGASTEEDHDASMASLAGYLAREREARPHLGAFLDRWAASSRPAPMMLKGAGGRPARTVGDPLADAAEAPS
jgi:predicted PolB exonuclease-like 3'-5' exonuclease